MDFAYGYGNCGRVLDTIEGLVYTAVMCNTTPADNPAQCRACGVLILDSFDDVCEDCATDMAQYYDSRDEEAHDHDTDWYYIEQEDLAADWQMTTDELVDRIIATGESEWD